MVLGFGIPIVCGIPVSRRKNFRNPDYLSWGERSCFLPFAEWMSCITFLLTFKISFFLCLQGYSNTSVATRDWKLCPIQWLCVLQPSKRALYLCKKFWDTGKNRDRSQPEISGNHRKVSSFFEAARMSLPVSKLRLLIICSEAKADMLWGVRKSSYKYLRKGVSCFKKVNAAAGSVSKVFIVANGGRQELYKIGCEYNQDSGEPGEPEGSDAYKPWNTNSRTRRS